MFKLRNVIKEDVRLIFDWANEIEARNMALNPSMIDWDAHLIWFESKLNDSNCFFYILQKNNINIGVIRFDKNELNEFIISYSIDKNHRGLGLGALILEKGLEMIRSLKIEGKFIAYVKETNMSSIKIFLKNSFKKTGEDIINNHIFYFYENKI